VRLRDRLGQVDLAAWGKPLILGAVTWLGGVTWGYYRSGEELRLQVVEHGRQLEGLPGRVHRMELAAEDIKTSVKDLKGAQEKQAKDHADAQQEILSILRRRRP
jgi:hypothetical protein